MSQNEDMLIDFSDVFMDSVNRDVSMRMMVGNSRNKPVSTRA